MLALPLLLLTSLLLAAPVSTGNNARISTTFGSHNKNSQSNADNNNNSHSPSSSGRPCTSEVNCTALVNTTCVVVTEEVGSVTGKPRGRCLCGDRTVPRNGVCRNTFRVLHFPCNVDEECVENAQCVDTNGTDSNKTGIFTSSGSVCVCRPGYMEEDQLRCTHGAAMSLLFPPGVLVCLLLAMALL